ncbi:MAG: NAD(+) synthase [Acholeplasmatales bacterium]|nr:NAD(+) synthase [Acholeplasmatales bacterium]
MLKEYGYVRVGAAVNEIHLCDVNYNVSEIIRLVKEADNKGVEILTFPELSIVGYTAQDMFLNSDLYNGCINGLNALKEFSKETKTIFIVGAPIRVNNSLYNCAISFYNGHIIGITPKTYIPNYNEFYEARYFKSANDLKIDKIELLGEEVLISNTLLYKCDNYDVTYAVDLCEDLWMANTPSNFTSLNGANLIFNLSSSNETVGKVSYRRNLVRTQSAKTLAAYVYASSGITESTSDILFSGHAMIAEPDGTFIENERFKFESNMIIQDVDIQRIMSDRIKERSYETVDFNIKSNVVHFSLINRNNNLLREYNKKPFLAHTKEGLEEILNIQAYALAKRVRHIGNAKMVIGISGGADSTLAFLVSMKVTKILNLPKTNVIAITMPGFGTSGRTYNNSVTLIKAYGADFREISIKDACIQHFKDINHKDGVYDITYENVQARERTQILFDVANQENGIVVGTGDMSELALGWATYNGDHMSNYGVNCSIPKTLVTTLIAHIRDGEEGVIRETLTDILNTPISPELLPLDDNGNIKQATEKSVGPYILNDFFLYHFLRYGAPLKKIYFLACKTFKDEFKEEEIKATLKVFVRRFFTQQFKRNCVPDGIKVGSVAVSPRGDLRMSSDTFNNMYLKELENL